MRENDFALTILEYSGLVGFFNGVNSTSTAAPTEKDFFF
jgi:hypothetical protein